MCIWAHPCKIFPALYNIHWEQQTNSAFEIWGTDVSVKMSYKNPPWIKEWLPEEFPPPAVGLWLQRESRVWEGEESDVPWRTPPTWNQTGLRATRTRRRTPDSAASRPARTRRKVEILQANSWGFRKIFSLRPPLKIPERLHHVPSMPFNSLSRSRSNPERPPSPGLENTWAPVQASGLFTLNLNPAVCKCFWSWPNRTSCFWGERLKKSHKKTQRASWISKGLCKTLFDELSVWNKKHTEFISFKMHMGLRIMEKRT